MLALVAILGHCHRDRKVYIRNERRTGWEMRVLMDLNAGVFGVYSFRKLVKEAILNVTS